MRIVTSLLIAIALLSACKQKPLPTMPAAEQEATDSIQPEIPVISKEERIKTFISEQFASSDTLLIGYEAANQKYFLIHQYRDDSLYLSIAELDADSPQIQIRHLWHEEPLALTMPIVVDTSGAAIGPLLCITDSSYVIASTERYSVRRNSAVIDTFSARHGMGCVFPHSSDTLYVHATPSWQSPVLLSIPPRSNPIATPLPLTGAENGWMAILTEDATIGYVPAYQVRWNPLIIPFYGPVMQHPDTPASPISLDSLRQYIHLLTKAAAPALHQQDTVQIWLNFVVSSKGKPVSPQLTHVEGRYGAMADSLRLLLSPLLRQMPTFNPATMDGQAVSTEQTLKIRLAADSLIQTTSAISL
ncbi:MAG: hypothetical protein IJ244_08950 [Bacteroidaceae bacterium]|nr:hypothetical protein [Bacteroidaceae bacterium]